MRVKENIQKSRTPFYKIIHDSPLAPQHLNSLHSFANPRRKIKLVDVIQTTTIKKQQQQASEAKRKRSEMKERVEPTSMFSLIIIFEKRTTHHYQP